MILKEGVDRIEWKKWNTDLDVDTFKVLASALNDSLTDADYIIKNNKLNI